MRTYVVYAVMAAVTASTAVFASDHSREYREHRNEYREREGRAEMYGIVKELPADRQGLWTVGNRKVQVDKNTYINEKRGPLKVGCTVEVKGSQQDGVIRAYEVEVKR